MRKQILAVEDSATQGEIMKFVLERSGYEVRLATNGRQALEALRSCRPDAVVTDIVMPEMDGFELCRQIKNDAGLTAIPVVLLTGLSDPVEVIRGLECGADGFIVKPNAPEELATRLDATLSARDEWQEEGEELRVVFHDRDFKITSSRRQILNLLLSTYETAVRKNHDLRQAQEDLHSFNLSLEEKVRERTTELAAEVAERKRAQERLMEANEALEQKAGQLRQLAHALTRTEQEERKRLAQVLHDNLQQLLVAAKMLIGSERGRADGEGREERLKQIEDLMLEAIETSRSLTVELCPPVLYEGGLLAGLDWLGRRMHDKYGLRVNMDIDSEAEPRDEEIRIFIFQAVRELLFNVFKHAGVDEAEVDLAPAGEALRLVVTDRGSGFASGKGMGREQSESFGLFHLQERADLIGGSLVIESEPGGGTSIFLTVPREKRNGEVFAAEAP